MACVTLTPDKELLPICQGTAVLAQGCCVLPAVGLGAGRAGAAPGGSVVCSPSAKISSEAIPPVVQPGWETT